MASVTLRHEVTSHVSDCINSSGGFLMHSNLLSDMVTVMTMEDVDPYRISNFVHCLSHVNGFHLDENSQQLLHQCVQAVQQHDTKTKIPPVVYANLQITWLGAQGKIRQHIVADG